ncbi:hypothetical protein DMN91_006083 [Ooceraea biroi]|uniref:Mitochondrial pyruvate carrier n=1 Tax=Ooceraea biroi TaxID=2015173 RepID=A0A3L8DMR3_OOCBI|nr:hypothetical protein DMN91_006083 [Ooceraea biroi]
MALPKKTSAYQRLVLKTASILPERFRAAFLHPAGPTTIFFWAPMFKWGLVIAGLGDINRPAHTISLSQTASLMVTGAIWSRYNIIPAQNCIHCGLYDDAMYIHAIRSNLCISRYSLVVTPKNYNLFSVNLFTCGTGAYNFIRGLLYQLRESGTTDE